MYVDPQWCSAAEAGLILGISPPSFRKLAQGGLVARRVYPGLRPVYLRADVEALAEAAVEPATVKRKRPRVGRPVVSV